MIDYGPHETTMIGDEVTLSRNPEIMADVLYRFEYKLTGDSNNLGVEITNVVVEEIKNPIYTEDGSPVVVMNEANRQKFVNTAYAYFWNRLVDHAEEKATDRVTFGRN